MADINGPLTVLPSSFTSTGGRQSASPRPSLWLRLHNMRYDTKLLRIGAVIMLSKTQSMFIKIATAHTKMAITLRTICQRSASRCSIKVISVSEPSLLRLFKKDNAILQNHSWTSKNEGAKLRVFGLLLQYFHTHHFDPRIA